MKIAISSKGNNLDAVLDSRFGRAQFFVLYDTETRTEEVHENNQNLNATQGAGIQSARMVCDLGVELVITGHVGPKAFKALQAAGINTLKASDGLTIREVIGSFEKQELSPLNAPDVEGHWA